MFAQRVGRPRCLCRPTHPAPSHQRFSWRFSGFLCSGSLNQGCVSKQPFLHQPRATHPCKRAALLLRICQPAPIHRAAGEALLNRLYTVSLAPNGEHSLSEASLLLNLIPASCHPRVADQGNLSSAPQHRVLVTHLLLCATLCWLTLGWKDGAVAPSLPIYLSVHHVSSPLPGESCIQILLQDELL